MGGQQSKKAVITGPKKRIVVIGASFAGQLITKELLLEDTSDNLEIILVDKNEHFEFICQIWECVTEDHWAKNTVKFAEAVQSFNCDRVTFEQGMLTNIDEQATKVSLQRASGDIEELTYDVLVVCCGATYNSPWKGASDQLQSMEDRKADWDNFRTKIQGAKSVCCVGAGNTGLETVTCIKEYYPDKTVGVAIRGQALMSSQAGAHNLLEPVLNQIGVEIHYGQTYAQEGDQIQSASGENYEVIIDCRGYKFTSPAKFMTGPLAECVDKAKGQIQIDINGRVTNVHPIATVKPSTPKTYPNIFGFGDVSISPVNEPKTIQTQYQMIGPFVKNIYEQAVGEAGIHPFKDIISQFGFTPLGTKNGLIIFNQLNKSGSNVSKLKSDIRTRWIKALSGDKKAQKADAKNFLNVRKIIGLSQGKLSFLPFHYSKQRSTDQANLVKAKANYDRVYAQ